MQDLLIIGGGLGGLTTAALAVQRGLTTTVLEASAQLGGRGASDRIEVDHPDGPRRVMLNRGAHAVYKAGTMASVVGELGLADVLKRGFTPPSKGLVLYEGEVRNLPWSMLGGGQAWEALRSARAALFGAELDQLPGGLSFSAWLDDHRVTGRARAYLEALVRLSTYHPSSTISARVALGQLRAALKGVVYLDGGWASMTNAIAAKATELGVTIKPATAALCIKRTAGGFAVEVRGQTGDARPVHTARQVVVALTRRRALALLRASDLGTLDVDIGAYADRESIFASTFDAILDALPSPRSRFMLSVDRPLYASVHTSARDVARGAPVIVQLMRYGGEGPREGSPPTGGGRAELERFMDTFQPGWRAHVLHARYLPKMEVAGLAADAAHGGLDGRPAVRLCKGVRLVGDWVGPTSILVDAAAASAHAAITAVHAELEGPAPFRLPLARDVVQPDAA